MAENLNKVNLRKISLHDVDIQLLPISDPSKSSTNVDGEKVTEPPTPKSDKSWSNFLGCFVNVYLYFLDFCDNTSIDGFKFLSERGRYLIEKIWWLIMVILALFCSFELISDAYTQWRTSPVVVTFAMTETPIWKIPFPAVTICPKINADPRIFNYSDVYIKHLNNISTTEEENKYFELFSLICNKDLEFVDANKTQFITQQDYHKFLWAFAKLDAKSCSWLGKSHNCSKILSRTLTEEGWCTTFNMLDYQDIYIDAFENLKNRTIENTRASQWSLEQGYSKTAGIDTFPRRTMLSGVDGGFEIVLFVNHDDLDYSCVNLQGFKVSIHHPAEEPDMGKYFRVPLDQAVVVGVNPKMISTADELEKYLPTARKCYFPGEKILSTYKVYSQQNCIDECLRNYTLELCKCTPFNVADENDAICGPGSRDCMKNAKRSFLRKELLDEEKDADAANVEDCNCLLSCTSLEFETETSQADWEWRKSIRSSDYVEKSLFNKNHLSRLQVYYKDLQFMTNRRHELSSLIDFLANCGGLVGLFCGFSFLSFVEIVYYLTLRLMCNFKKFGYKFWSGDKEFIKASHD